MNLLDLALVSMTLLAAVGVILGIWLKKKRGASCCSGCPKMKIPPPRRPPQSSSSPQSP